MALAPQCWTSRQGIPLFSLRGAAYTSYHTQQGRLATRCPLRVKTGKAQREQMFSALPLKPDIAENGRHVRLVPILLQKSFCITDCKFSGPYVRRSNNHLRDYVILR